MPETHQMAIFALWQTKLFIYHHFWHWVIINNHQDLYQTHSGSLEHDQLHRVVFLNSFGVFFIYTVFYTVFRPWRRFGFKTVHPYAISTAVSLPWSQRTCMPVGPGKPYKISTVISVPKYQRSINKVFHLLDPGTPTRFLHINFSTRIPKHLRIY